MAEVIRGLAEPKQYPLIESLVGLLLDNSFQDAHFEQVNDPGALQDDLLRALRLVAASRAPRALFLTTKAALGLPAFRAERLRPEEVFVIALFEIISMCCKNLVQIL